MDLDECMAKTRFDVNAKEPTSVVLKCTDGIPFAIKFRPGLKQFLDDINTFADVYAFTAGMELYGSVVFKYLDPRGDIFKHCWYRDSTIYCRIGSYHFHAKDLQKSMGSDFIAERTVLVDNSVFSFVPQPDNGVFIRDYHGADDDHELERIQNVLRTLKDMVDVRTLLCKQWENEVFIRHLYGNDVDSSKLRSLRLISLRKRYIVEQS